MVDYVIQNHMHICSCFIKFYHVYFCALLYPVNHCRVARPLAHCHSYVLEQMFNYYCVEREFTGVSNHW